jgi:hypothetical protein
VVPFSTIAALAANRALPNLPADVEALGKVPKHRPPTIAECEAQTWLLCTGPVWTWKTTQTILGVASFLDRYDYVTSSDVREISTVQGSARACVELVRWMAADAKEHGRRVIGEVCVANVAMGHAMEKLGARPTRIVYEDLSA